MPTHLQNLIINFPTPKCNIPFDFFALYMLYLKYVIFTDERKSITVAAKNVTLSAKLFFLTTEPYKKMPLNPYSYWAPCR